MCWRSNSWVISSLPSKVLKNGVSAVPRRDSGSRLSLQGDENSTDRILTGWNRKPPWPCGQMEPHHSSAQHSWQARRHQCWSLLPKPGALLLRQNLNPLSVCSHLSLTSSPQHTEGSSGPRALPSSLWRQWPCAWASALFTYLYSISGVRKQHSGFKCISVVEQTFKGELSGHFH